MPKHMPPTRETNPIRPGRSARIGRPHLAYDASRHESSSFSPESRRFLPLRVLRRCRRFLGLPRRRPLLPFVLRYPALFRLFQAPVARPLSPSLSTLTVALTPAADLAGLRVGRRFADKVHRLLLVTPGRSLPVSKLAHIVPGARWRRAGEVGRAGELLRARAHGLGGKAWEEASVFSGELEDSIFSGEGGGATKCPGSLALGGGSGGGAEGETVAFLPCGLAVGSAVTVVGTAQAHLTCRRPPHGRGVLPAAEAGELEGIREGFGGKRSEGSGREA